jgi:hypothetical protein
MPALRIFWIRQNWKLPNISWNSCNVHRFNRSKDGTAALRQAGQPHAVKRKAIGMPGIRMPFYKVTWF